MLRWTTEVEGEGLEVSENHPLVVVRWRVSFWKDLIPSPIVWATRDTRPAWVASADRTRTSVPDVFSDVLGNWIPVPDVGAPSTSLATKAPPAAGAPAGLTSAIH